MSIGGAGRINMGILRYFFLRPGTSPFSGIGSAAATELGRFKVFNSEDNSSFYGQYVFLRVTNGISYHANALGKENEKTFLPYQILLLFQ